MLKLKFERLDARTTKIMVTGTPVSLRKDMKPEDVLKFYQELEKREAGLEEDILASLNTAGKSPAPKPE